MKKVLILIGSVIALLILIFFLLIQQNPENDTKISKSEKSNIVIIPENIENNCIGFDIGMPEEVGLVSQIGGGWIRPNLGTFSWGFIEPEKGKFDFSMTDEYVKEAQEKDIAILMRGISSGLP
jgi:hypothetical protein